jgi:hypothetical protein
MSSAEVKTGVMTDPVLELALLEESKSQGFHVWAAIDWDRAERYVEYNHSSFKAAEEAAATVEGLVGGDIPLELHEFNDFGAALFEVLFHRESLALYRNVPEARRVSLGVMTKLARLLAIPWEYLRDPNAPLGPSFKRPVIRVVPTVGRLPLPRRRKEGKKAKVLFIAPDPTDQKPTSWVREKQELATNFDLWPRDVELEVLDPPTKAELTLRLRDANDTFDVVHIVAHGDSSQLLMEDPQGQSDAITANDLSAFLNGRGVGLVVLSSCAGGQVKYQHVFAEFAPALVRVGIPAVVAMQYPVRARTAITFASTFYRCLLQQGMDLDRALIEARLGLVALFGTQSVEWGVPVLYRSLTATNPFDRTRVDDERS